MYFPVADIELHPILPPLIAFVVSLFTSMGGVSGAFLLLPFQVSILGFHTPAVSPTNQLFNIVAIPSGVYRYLHEGRMVWPLTWMIVLGTLPGVFIGAVLRIQYFPDPKNFKLVAGLILLFIGGRLLKDVLGREEKRENKHGPQESLQKLMAKDSQRHTHRLLPKITVRRFQLSGIVYEFDGRNHHINTLGVALLGFLVGIAGGVYGIGGGALMAPFLIGLFGLSVYTVAGAALMSTLVTSIAGVLVYQLLVPVYPMSVIAPDWKLGFLFGIGGFAGMYCGARLQKFFPEAILKWILAGCILFIATSYIVSFFL